MIFLTKLQHDSYALLINVFDVSS